MARPREDSHFRLLVEGRDDLASIAGLMARHGYDWDKAGTTRPYIVDCKGVDNVFEETEIALESPAYRRLGIVLDADQHPSRRWDALRDRCHGFELPPSPPAEGFVGQGGQPGKRLGLWLMPDNSRAGTLEDLLATLIPSGDQCWALAERCAEAARQQGCADNPTPLKHQLHTWLAWQHEPGSPFGTALTARVLGHDSPQALAFVAWFRRLFVEPEPTTTAPVGTAQAVG